MPDDNSSENISGLRLVIMSVKGTAFDGEASLVTLNGVDGEFGVMSGHMPMVAAIKSGVIRVTSTDGVEHAFCSGPEGLVEVKTDNTCVVIADYVEDLNDAKIEDVKQAISDGADVMSDKKSDFMQYLLEIMSNCNNNNIRK